jgi:hypothetical protein
MIGLAIVAPLFCCIAAPVRDQQKAEKAAA